MALGDRIRRNIAHVDPSERTALKNAIVEMHRRYYPGKRDETPPGGVSWWFKQDEIHQATHVHGGPEFLPWHRELTNRFEELLRQVNPQLSLHYWDFREDPRNIPNGNIGGGRNGKVNLFDSNFMGSSSGSAGDPWLAAGFYDPLAGTTNHPQNRDITENGFDSVTDIPRTRLPAVAGGPPDPFDTTNQSDALGINNNQDFPSFRVDLENLHNGAHPYFAAVDPHHAFRDPFVFLLHSNVDRIYAQWQTDPRHPERLDQSTLYGAESNLDVPTPDLLGNIQIQNLTHLVEPWSTGIQISENRPIRPWEPTHENQGVPHTYHHISVVLPPLYDTNHTYLHWKGDFAVPGKSEVLFWFDDGDWSLGTFTGNQISLTKVGNTVGFGNLADGAHPSWVGDFTGSGKAEILFNYVGDGNWWLGTLTGNQISFTKVGNTVGFGNLADGAHPSWVGDFTGSGKAEILFNYVGDGNWWLGTFTGNQISFTKVGNTVGFGNLADRAHPSWVGDFTGSRKAEILFNYVGDGNWWLGTFTGNQISFTWVGNTIGFGNLADGAHPSWVGDFTGSGKAEILFNYVGDGNWWLGTFSGNQISFTRVGNTVGFGDLADGAHPSWVGDFTGSGKAEILFNYVGDGNWWLGTFTGNQIGFTKAGNTVGFGNLADGAHPSWVGDFTGSGKAEMLFNYVGDGNWWLGTFTGNQISFTKAGTTAVRIGMVDGTTR